MANPNKNDGFLKKIQSTINTNFSILPTSKFVLMVSGGADSCALAYSMQNLFGAKRCCICHLNHMLRPQADDEQQFVESMAQQLGVRVFSKKIDVAKYSKAALNNIEADARNLRYEYANEVAQDFAGKNAIIATAHSQNDRVENFFMRAIVGTGPDGFSGMSYKTGNVIRPLLDVSRSEIEEFVRNFSGHYVHSDGRT